MSVRLDAVLRGKFVTFDDARPTAQAIGVLHGRIVAFDDDATTAPATHTYDLAHAVCFPGFHDAHAHTVSFGYSLVELDLSTPPIHSLDQLCDAVRRRAAELPEGALVVGRGYDQNKLGGQHPSRAAMDAAGGGRPVALLHTSGHMCVLNSAALALIGPDLGLPIDGGRVVRDAAGESTGLLEERAQVLARRLVVPRSVASIATAIAAAHRVFVREGLTSVCDAGVAGGWIGESPAELDGYQTARERGDLLVRTTAMVAADVLHGMDRHPDDLAARGVDGGIRTGLGDDWLRIGAMKVFSDGSLIGRTCWLTHGFEDDPGNLGYPQLDPETLRAQIVEAHLAGWQVATHAIGDAAVSFVLDAYEAALEQRPRRDHRHRIEHCGITTPAALRRIARLGVIPVPQGRFIGELGDGMLAALGERRAADTYRLASFLRAGVVLPGSSDRPVVDGRPLLGIADMTARRTQSGRPFAPAEALTVDEAMRSYTVGSAFATRTEADRGTLSLGKLADVVALGADPRTLADDPSALGEVPVIATFVGGELRYSS
ncbi:MAG TPA: amidohydrolase [Acidimicrobiales bacterium]|nr:amidohydrolase [Acidimicrobiales bacterium]